MPVVAAFEFHDAVTSGMAARQTDGAHGGFGAGTHHADQLDGGHEAADALSEPGLDLGGSAEGETIHRGAPHRLHDLGVGMAREHGTPGTHVIEIASSVGGMQ